MPTNLPYLGTANSLKTALEKIQSAATPDRVTIDFVNNILQIKGGTGNSIIPYLKKIGLVSTDGSPTDLYKRYRNQTTGGAAIADAVRIGYKPLLEANEYFYSLNDADLKSLVVQVTGLDKENSVVKQVCATFRVLKAFATFDSDSDPAERPRADGPRTDLPMSVQIPNNTGIGMNLSYTINLNLPATSDQAVFNAIFKSLKEHLLKNE